MSIPDKPDTKSQPPSNEQRDTGKGEVSNALANETSPYLLQHANNPVDWYPWSEEALSLAERHNKPILLSVGYSACHWCHVMAHESFEDPETADVMNRHFVNIKVDREERPDIDRIYQTAQQLLTQRAGGWPLTMFLTPGDHIPFFGGTYFPPEPRFGLPGFRDLLMRIAELYEKEYESIRKQNIAVSNALEQLQKPGDTEGITITDEPVSTAVRELAGYFDADYGGYGGAPKFPQAPNLEFLLSLSGQSDQETAGIAMKMLNVTLMRMGEGGIYDHLGGGFCRYAVDQFWQIPHFEKMLYDNGALAYVYAQAWKLTGNDYFRDIARETADWLIRDMQSGEGGFYSSLDADSEGVEGKFYTWDRKQVERLLDKTEFRDFAALYGLDDPPNFEGTWHLHIAEEFSAFSPPQADTIPRNSDKIRSAREKLLNARNSRVWPGRDEKILTAWNALAIRGIAMTAQRLGDERFLASAERAMDFLHETMWDSNRLYASYKDGKRHLNAYLDDYVFMIDALLTLLSVKWNRKYLEFAMELADAVVHNFYDREHGGFYFTSHDHEPLIQRRRDFMDDATPSGNGVAVRVLIQMTNLTGNHEYLDAADRTLKAAWEALESMPHAHASMLLSLFFHSNPSMHVIIRGPEDTAQHWLKRCYQSLSDINARVFAIPHDAPNLTGILPEPKPGSDTTAYICEGTRCREPVTDLDSLIGDLMLSC